MAAGRTAARVIKALAARLTNKKKAEAPNAKSHEPPTPPPTPYTEEEAKKVRDRLQGMGYVWHI